VFPSLAAALPVGIFGARREYYAPHLSRRLLIPMQNGQASRTGDPARRQRQSLPGLGRCGNINSILKTDFPGNADERHPPGTVLHLAHSRQDLLNLLPGLSDGLSMTRNGNEGVSTGRILMWVSISD
jgi:hypothetical protein